VQNIREEIKKKAYDYLCAANEKAYDYLSAMHLK